MTGFPAYVNALMLALIASIIARTHGPVQWANAYLYNVASMIACHEALLQYADANPGTVGTIPAAAVDALLGPGVSDPGLYAYVIAAPGTAATYTTTTSLQAATVIQIVQQLSAYAVTAGPVVAGTIVPAPPAAPVAAIAGIPDGVIAIQTIVRSN